MALTSSQIASRLFKKSLGAGETLVSRQFFEEPRLGNEFVLSNQLWTDSNQIPNTAPSLPSGSSSGVVQYFSLDSLTHVAGSTNLSYYSANLIDSIPFNFGTSGTYNYQLYKNDGVTAIAFGDGDWLVDNSAGLLTFYGTLPSGVSSAAPPKISFYKYIGSKGFPVNSGGTITGVTAGNGLSGGGTQGFFTLDVNVNSDSLEITSDQIRLKDTISGDRTFSDSVVIQGNLTVEGTQSIIYTENIYLQDTIITLNATYSGPYNAVDSGIEANLGGGTYATLIWDSTNSLWSAGYSGSVDSLITSAGIGLTKSGDELSIDFPNLVGSGLTQNGTQISIDTLGFASVLAGDGLSSTGGTLSVNVGNGLEIVSDVVYLGGTLSQNTSLNLSGYDLTFGDVDTLSITGSILDIILDDGLFVLDAGDSGSVDIYGGDVLIFATGSVDIASNDEFTLTTGTGSITTTNLEGLVYTSDYSATFVANSLVSKSYVDSVVSSVGATNGLSEITSGQVGLGGTLSQNTTINTNTFDLSIRDGANYITNKISGKSGIAYRIGTDANAGFGINNSATFDLESIKVVAEKEIVIYNSFDSFGIQPTIIVESDSNSRVELGLKTSSTSSVVRIQSTSPTSSAMIVIDSMSQKGFVNDGDYESNFVDRSLVTKQYVDSIVGSVGATNGLSEISSGVVGLGGTLSQNTVVNSDGYSFTIQDFDILTLTGSIVDVQLDNGLFLVDVGSDGSIDLYGGDAMIFATGSIDLISIDEFAVNTATGSITTSNLKGLVYTSDYSATFVNDSLITKKYVDDSVASLGSGTIAGVTAGSGLSGGGTSGYISIDVNLGIDSGLTFSGDSIIIDSNIAGNGLDFTSGILTVNTSEINTSLAGNGLTANGSSIDVNVNPDSLEIIGDVIRLKDSISGDRIFEDSVTVQGNLNVTGTVSYIYTENVYIEDNILTLNATWSGSPILNAGLEVIRGTEDVASLIWNESTDLWSAGLSGSEVSILLNAGTGLVKNGSTVSLDLTSITGTGLTQNGNQISIDTSGFATGLAGDGLSANGGTLSVNVGNGLSLISDTVYLGGTLSQNTVINGSSQDLNIEGLGNLSITASNTLQFRSIDGSGFDKYVQVSNSDVLLYSGDISDYTSFTITNNSSEIITQVGGNTFSRVQVNGNGAQLLTFDGVNTNAITLGQLPTSVGDGSTNNHLIVQDYIASKGLVYQNDYSANFTTYSLVTKGYVDSLVSGVGATNGITEITPGVIGLGGDLTQNTTLIGNSYDFVISNVDTLLFTASVFDIEADSFISLDAGTGSMQLLADKDIDIVAVSGELGLGGLTGLVTISSGEGLVYAGSYSATFVTHSLVDKYYVDQQVSGLGSGTIAGVTAGAGLSGGGTANYITLDVNVANGLVINGDNVEISPSIAGVGLTFSSGVLSVIAGSSQPFYDEFVAVTTTGNDAVITGVTISSTPNDYSRIEVFVNGQRQRLGDNVTNKDCYFGPSPGSAIPLTSVVVGTQLYWNGNNAGFDLSSTDIIEIVYEI